MDPAWWYPERNNEDVKFGQGVHGHYPVMRIEEIEKLPIPELAAENCALFMWVTTPRTDDSDLIDKLMLFRKWGFRLVNLGFDFIKLNPKSLTPFFGVGKYTKSNSEQCYLGMKGQLEVKSNFISQLVFAPNIRHSEKPEKIRKDIDELFGADLPSLEIFARPKKEPSLLDSIGWNASNWHEAGNEVDGIDIFESLERLIKL